jgi:hypothetical protein
MVWRKVPEVSPERPFRVVQVLKRFSVLYIIHGNAATARWSLIFP